MSLHMIKAKNDASLEVEKVEERQNVSNETHKDVYSHETNDRFN